MEYNTPAAQQRPDQLTTSRPPRSPGKMRARQRPASSHGPAPQQKQQQQQQQQLGNTAATRQQPPRKMFNCIVDDTALVAGVKRSTRNGIRQWVKNGQIRLFVPLHALDQLRRHMSSSNHHGEDVRETLQWLDDATSKHPNFVTLQGADEIYEQWAEVEKFVVPRTLFSEYYLEHEADNNDHDNDDEYSALPDEAASKLSMTNAEADGASLSSEASHNSASSEPSSRRSVRSSASPASPPTSPTKTAASPAANIASLGTSAHESAPSSAAVPRQLQDLFNYILWRIHQETDPVAALESFIFLCNDPGKAHLAKGFDIKTKRLEQLRDAVAREDRDSRNRQLVLTREVQRASSTTPPRPSSQEANEANGTAGRPKTPKAPAAMLNKQQSNLIDPNAFGGRGPQPFAPADPSVTSPKSPRAAGAQPARGSPRGAHALPFAPRGNGRGHARGNSRGNGRGRGNAFGAGRGGGGGFALGGSIDYADADASPPGKQIDPNSFARPEPRGAFSRGRGGRKLWVPT